MCELRGKIVERARVPRTRSLHRSAQRPMQRTTARQHIHWPFVAAQVVRCISSREFSCRLTAGHQHVRARDITSPITSPSPYGEMVIWPGAGRDKGITGVTGTVTRAAHTNEHPVRRTQRPFLRNCCHRCRLPACVDMS